MTKTIYLLTNLVNGKYYVGQTKSFRSRIASHLSYGKRGAGCPYLARAIQKYGTTNFAVDVLAECPGEQSDNLERLWITALNACDKSTGYNLAFGGKSVLGYKWSEESRRKLSQSAKGNKRRLGMKSREETKQKISKSLIGHVISQETRDKISATLIARNAAQLNV